MSSKVFRSARQPMRLAPADEISGGYMIWAIALFVGLYLLVAIPAWCVAIALAGRTRRRAEREPSSRPIPTGMAIIRNDCRGMATISHQDATRNG